MDNYESISFHVSPFSLGNKTRNIHENLENRLLDFSFDSNSDNLKFFINSNKVAEFCLDENYYGFKLEYQDSKGMRLLSLE